MPFSDPVLARAAGQRGREVYKRKNRPRRVIALAQKLGEETRGLSPEEQAQFAELYAAELVAAAPQLAALLGLTGGGQE